MEKKKEFAIGFVSGRQSVCDIINTYYSTIQQQLGEEANLTFFILYDLSYQKLSKKDFYKIKPEVYENGVKVKHIGTEEIDLEKEIIQRQYNITEEEANLFLGHGYCKARNTILYFALKNNIDYLLFWDDDEYPVACFNNDNNLIWKEQNNIATHMKYISNADITFGYRCGYNSPIPYIDFDKFDCEKEFSKFIDAVSNEAVTWEKVKKVMKQNGITYAEEKILNENKIHRLHKLGISEWLLGSGLCINLDNINKIPAFYNPPKARGEDTFFSTLLNGANVVQVPTYHFHDGFLKYTNIMDKQYPDTLKKIILEDRNVEKRFLDACIGWIKYKPLLLYITQRYEYKEKIAEIKMKLKESIPKMNEIFPNIDFSIILTELNEYDENVYKHYKEYIRTNNIWNTIKRQMVSNGGKK